MEADKSLDSGESYFHRHATNWNVQVLPASDCIYMLHDDLLVTFRWIKPGRQMSQYSTFFFHFKFSCLSSEVYFIGMVGLKY